VAERGRRWEAATETMPLRHCPLAAAPTESQLQAALAALLRPGRGPSLGAGKLLRPREASPLALPCPAPDW
jgi:hypothetical protein